VSFAETSRSDQDRERLSDESSADDEVGQNVEKGPEQIVVDQTGKD
jgi:hypothetical protein